MNEKRTALIEAAQAFADPKASSRAATVAYRAVEALPDLRASLARDKAIAAYVVELRANWKRMESVGNSEGGYYKGCADRLESIMEMK